MVELMDKAIDAISKNLNVTSAYVLDMLMREGRFNITSFCCSLVIFIISIYIFLRCIKKYKLEEKVDEASASTTIFCILFFIISAIYFFQTFYYFAETLNWFADPQAYAFDKLTSLLRTFK